jgi:hypothetical protein
MSAMHTNDGRHRTEVRFERYPGGFTNIKRTEYVAVCDCGWVGRPMVTARDAKNDADDHVNYATES